MAGLPQKEIAVLNSIDNKLAKLISITQGEIPSLLQDLTAVDLSKIEQLLRDLLALQTEQKATSLGGTFDEIPKPPQP